MLGTLCCLTPEVLTKYARGQYGEPVGLKTGVQIFSEALTRWDGVPFGEAIWFKVGSQIFWGVQVYLVGAADASWFKADRLVSDRVVIGGRARVYLHGGEGLFLLSLGWSPWIVPFYQRLVGRVQSLQWFSL